MVTTKTNILQFLFILFAIVNITSQHEGVTKEKLYERINYYLDNEILPKLTEFVNIPNLSRMYDPDFFTNGLIEKVNELYFDWFKTMDLKGVSKAEIYQEDGRTPLIFIVVEPTDPSTTTNILLYGHNDKQPHMLNDWSEGLHPFKAVRRGDKMYGRGVSDDGYAFQAAVTMIKLLQENGIAHPRFVIFVENDEESGSSDIMYHMDLFKKDIGEIDLIMCLDSGASDYEHFYQTTTLRGFTKVQIDIKTMKSSVHSGLAGGVVPDAFRIFRMLLSRLEDENTGRMPEELYGDIPCELYSGACKLIEHLGSEFLNGYPVIDGMQFQSKSALESYFNGNFRPSLTVIGIDNMPSTATGGNVLRQEMSASLSIRLPPWISEETVKTVLDRQLTQDLPYGAKVDVKYLIKAGFYSPPWPKDHLQSLQESAKEAFDGKDMFLMSCGGSIPFMGDLQRRFPEAKFLVTGVLGPDNNAHAGDEMLYIPMLRKLLYTLTRFVEKSSSTKWKEVDVKTDL